MTPLPYRQRATIQEQDGTAVAEDVPVSVWPATQTSQRNAGLQHDHTGEAPLTYAQQLRGRNRRLVITRGSMLGQVFQITAAVEQDIVQHTQLELRSTGRV